MKKISIFLLLASLTISACAMQEDISDESQIITIFLPVSKEEIIPIKNDVREFRGEMSRVHTNRIFDEIEKKLPKKLKADFNDKFHRLIPNRHTYAVNHYLTNNIVKHIINNVKTWIAYQRAIGIKNPIIQTRAFDPLSWAIEIGNIEFLKYLLNEGADPGFSLTEYQPSVQNLLSKGSSTVPRLTETLEILEGLNQQDASQEAQRRQTEIEEILEQSRLSLRKKPAPYNVEYNIPLISSESEEDEYIPLISGSDA